MHTTILETALQQREADILIKNGQIVDVFTGTIYEATIAITDGYIAGIGNYTQGKTTIDANGAYIVPGFINAHCHVESAMTTPDYYCLEEARWGVTTVITDPHEIANVAGVAGIMYMLEATKDSPLNYYIQLPSSVPATPFEHAGATLTAKELAPLLTHPSILGLGEVMNVPGLLEQDNEIATKLALCQHRPIDGHAPGLTGPALQAYVGASIQTDHESTSWAEAKEKIRAGMAILVREGTACKNLEPIITGVVKEQMDTHRLAFCTDDKHLAHIHKEGTIRYCLQKAVALGLNPIKAIQMATINPATFYGLSHLGALGPGKQADLVFLQDLVDFLPLQVWHKGNRVDTLETPCSTPCPEELKNSVHLAPVEENFFSPASFEPAKTYPVIEMIGGEILTRRGEIKGAAVPQALKEHKLCMIAVLERHHRTEHRAIGLIRGYGLRQGAVATTVAHDSHNLIVIGTEAADMMVAVKELERVQGGYAIVKNHEPLRTLPLSIAGLMSPLRPDRLIEELETIKTMAHHQGVPETLDPFISLSFMALPVIPTLRITDSGMFDVETGTFL